MSSAPGERTIDDRRVPSRLPRPEPEPEPPWIAGHPMTQSRWLRVVFAWCAGVGTATMPLLGGGGAVDTVATLALWAALLTALATWSSRQRLVWTGLTAGIVAPASVYVGCYAVSVGIGLRWWPGVSWAWLTADAATLATALAVAVLTRRLPDRRAGSRSPR